MLTTLIAALALSSTSPSAEGVARTRFTLEPVREGWSVAVERAQRYGSAWISDMQVRRDALRLRVDGVPGAMFVILAGAGSQPPSRVVARGVVPDSGGARVVLPGIGRAAGLGGRLLFDLYDYRVPGGAGPRDFVIADLCLEMHGEVAFSGCDTPSAGIKIRMDAAWEVTCDVGECTVTLASSKRPELLREVSPDKEGGGLGKKGDKEEEDEPWDAMDVELTCDCGDGAEEVTVETTKSSSEALTFIGCGKTFQVSLGENGEKHDTWGEGPNTCDQVVITAN